MDDPIFITLHALSRRLGLPAAWIKAEADAGRIPSLRAGRRLMFNPDAVNSTLNDRAQARSAEALSAQHEKGADDD